MIFKRLGKYQKKDLAKYQANSQIDIILRTQVLIPLVALIKKVWTNGNNIPRKKL